MLRFLTWSYILWLSIGLSSTFLKVDQNNISPLSQKVLVRANQKLRTLFITYVYVRGFFFKSMKILGPLCTFLEEKDD